MKDLIKPTLGGMYFKGRDEEKYPIRRGEKLEVGKTYRTRSGHRVRIYAIEHAEIHGSINYRGVWEIDKWNKDGSYTLGKENEKDILIKAPLELIPGRKYKTRSGRLAKVIEINKDSIEFPVVGIMRDEADQWVPRVWNIEGVTKRPYGPGNDLVVEWSET